MYAELEDLFLSAGEILNSMAHLRGEPGFVIFGDESDDFLATLELIDKGVQANAQELERQIGPCPDSSGSF
jgi:hypothetical protein